ncbi:hypothetical protein D3C72_1977830 [compost metagenome]
MASSAAVIPRADRPGAVKLRFRKQGGLGWIWRAVVMAGSPSLPSSRAAMVRRACAASVMLKMKWRARLTR